MEQERHNEIRGLLQILEQTAEIAEDSILTEAYKDGEDRCISQFNKVLKRLSEINAVPKDLFEPLQDNASFSEICIACNHLAAYLSEGLGSFPDLKGMMTNILGKKFIENVTDELKESKFGDLIRNSMPDFLTVTTFNDINESFDVCHNGLKKLILETDFGKINIQTADTDKVNVFVRRSAQLKSDRKAAEILNDFQVTFNEEDKNLKIHGKFSEDNQRKNSNDSIDILFDIIVPKCRSDIKMKTMNGDITVEDVNGAVECRTANGNLQFQNITGLIFAHTENGNVRLNKGKGDVRLETFRGDIDVINNIGCVDTITSGGNVRCTDVVGKISAETSGGFIRIIECIGGANLDASGGSIDVVNDGPVSIKTIGGSINAAIVSQLKDDSVLEASGGDINISLISAIVVKLDARSVGGEVVSELPVMKTNQDTSDTWKLQGVINGEGPLLTLRSVGGNINLKRNP